MQEVEKLGADVKLTEAITHLQCAKNNVTEIIESRIYIEHESKK